MRIYLKRDGSAPNVRLYLVAVLSANESPSGRRQWRHIRWDPYQAFLAEEAQRERSERLAIDRRCRNLVGGNGRPGRPTTHPERAVLATAGINVRSGGRYQLSRAFTPLQRAEKLHGLLDNEWRQRLTVSDLAELEMAITSRRASRNRRGGPWDIAQETADILDDILKRHGKEVMLGAPVTLGQQIDEKAAIQDVIRANSA